MTTANSHNNKFRPTAEMRTAAENVFIAMAIEGTIRPIVEAYQLKILGERVWPVREKYLSDPGHTRQVQGLKDTFLMSEADFEDFSSRCNAERIAANLCVESDQYCPLLVAENVTRMAEALLIDAMASITKIRSDDPKLLLNDRAKLVDMTLKLLAPFVQPPLPKPTK